ncbi:MAG: proline--tRNA ligase, partial [Mycoplasmatales bacterium]
ELFRVSDRKGSQFALAPTHEEVITDVVSNYLNSYKKLPLNLYQIGTKMRDELRPRFGLLRGREFVMMDGYSFHANYECLDKTYYQYFNAYEKIFTRLGLDFKVVKADNGEMGGSNSHEFMALADIGEDTIVYEQNEQLAFNIEVAPIYYNGIKSSDSAVELNKINTPNCKTIESLTEQFNIDPTDLIKAILFDVDGKLVMALVRGDRDVNEIKVLKVLGGKTIDFANSELLEKHNVISGFVGPIDAHSDIEIILDQELVEVSNSTVGGNKLDTHINGVNYERDLSKYKIADIRNIEVGDLMREGGQPVSFARGIEIGHIFALGDKYTMDLNVEFLTKEQKKKTPVMGCYGIGVSRIISAIIEQSHDENGIIMPQSITPFDIHLIPLDYNKKLEQQ